MRQSVRRVAYFGVLVLSTLTGSRSVAAADAASLPGVVRVAVPNMIAVDKSDEKLAEALTDVLLVESNKLRGVEVIGMQDIEAVLGLEQQKTLLGCDDVTCMAEIGGALGVQAIVSSKVARVGRTYLLTIRVIDTKAVKPINSVQESVEGPPDALIAAARRLMPQALAPLANAPPEEMAARPGAAPSASPKEESGGGISWPAAAVTGIGGIGAIASVVVIGVAWGNFFGTGRTILVGSDLYFPPGSQRAANGAASTELIGCGICGCSSLTIVAGLIWQFGTLLFGGGGD